MPRPCHDSRPDFRFHSETRLSNKVSVARRPSPVADPPVIFQAVGTTRWLSVSTPTSPRDASQTSSGNEKATGKLGESLSPYLFSRPVRRDDGTETMGRPRSRRDRTGKVDLERPPAITHYRLPNSIPRESSNASQGTQRRIEHSCERHFIPTHHCDFSLSLSLSLSLCFYSLFLFIPKSILRGETVERRATSRPWQSITFNRAPGR